MKKRLALASFFFKTRLFFYKNGHKNPSVFYYFWLKKTNPMSKSFYPISLWINQSTVTPYAGSPAGVNLIQKANDGFNKFRGAKDLIESTQPPVEN